MPVCPVCNGSLRPPENDWSWEQKGRELVVTGKVHYIIRPGQADYPPLSNLITAVVGEGPRKYVKLLSEQALKDFPHLHAGNKVLMEGCVHKFSKRGAEKALIFPTKVSSL